MAAFQFGEEIYYRTIKDVGPDTELTVWYGDDYGRELGLVSFINTVDFSQLSMFKLNV